VVSRRRFLAWGAAGVGAVGASACQRAFAGAGPHEQGRLTVRPAPPTGTVAPGRQSLALGGSRDGLLYVPAAYDADVAAPLAVMLHGAGGSARSGIRPFETLADEAGLLLVVPESRGMTWDIIEGGFGPDVAFLDQVLAAVFRKCRVDPARIAIEGFSDGASYALSLGLSNGDLFGRVVAFSPGFMRVLVRTGKPELFVSHGTDDPILPVRDTSRRLVPQLERSGYAVRYREFTGGHTVPASIALEAATWVSGKAQEPRRQQSEREAAG
jgi:predicted esterase